MPTASPKQLVLLLLSVLVVVHAAAAAAQQPSSWLTSWLSRAGAREQQQHNHQHDTTSSSSSSTPFHAHQHHGEITSLPGYDGTFSSKHYGGYISVGGRRNLYYYLVESERNPANDPVV